MALKQLPVGEATIDLMERSQWEASDPNNQLDEYGEAPREYVIVSHEMITKPCTDTSENCIAMRTIQEMHQTEKGFYDIAFNYVIANDGIVYEGRGEKYVPATAKGWNFVSYGIAFMGKFNAEDEHCQAALKAAELLLKYLCDQQKLAQNFTVYGLRQVRPYDLPQMELYEVIQKWPQWKPYGKEKESQQAAAQDSSSSDAAANS